MCFYYYFSLSSLFLHYDAHIYFSADVCSVIHLSPSPIWLLLSAHAPDPGVIDGILLDANRKPTTTHTHAVTIQPRKKQNLGD